MKVNSTGLDEGVSLAHSLSHSFAKTYKHAFATLRSPNRSASQENKTILRRSYSMDRNNRYILGTFLEILNHRSPIPVTPESNLFIISH